MTTQQKEIKTFTPVSREVIRSMKGLITPDSNFYKVDFDIINPDTIFNERTEYGDIEAFGDELHENGMHNPIIGTFVEKKDGPVMFDMSDGFRRHASLAYNISIGREVGQVLVQNRKMSLEDRYVLMWGTQNHTKQLTPLEASNNLRKLLHFLKVDEISKRICKSTTYINDMLELSRQTQSVKDAVKNKQTTATAVNIVSKKFGADAASKLVKESIDKNEKFSVKKALAIVDDKPSAIQTELSELSAKLNDTAPAAEKPKQTAPKVNMPYPFKDKPEKEGSKFTSIFYTEFCTKYCPSIGNEKAVDIFNFFRNELETEE